MKLPLVVSLGFYAFGILAGYFLQSAWLLAFFFILGVLLAGCLFVINRWPGMVFMPVLLVAGYVNISVSMEPEDGNIGELARRGREAVFVGRVVSLSTTRNGAQRATILLESARYGSENFQSRARITALVSERSFAHYQEIFAPYEAYNPYEIFTQDQELVSWEMPPSPQLYETYHPFIQEGVLNGQQLVFSGTPQHLSRRRNPSGFNEFQFYRSRGISYSIAPQILYRGDILASPLTVLDSLRNTLIEVYDTVLPEREAALARSIVLGDRSSLEWEISELYRAAGLAHILVVSGLHISIIALIIERIMLLFFRPRHASLAALCILGLYVALTGFGVSAIRAFIMYATLTLGNILGRKRDMLTSISFAAFILLVHQPLYLLDVGFQFSFAAVYALAIGMPPIEALRWPALKRMPHFLRSALSSTLVIALFTAPIGINTFSFFYPYSIITNALIIPTLFLATLSGFAIGIVGLVSSELAIFMAGVFYAMMQLYELVARTSVAMPGSAILVGYTPYPIWGLWWLTLILTSMRLGIKKSGRMGEQCVSTTSPGRMGEQCVSTTSPGCMGEQCASTTSPGLTSNTNVAACALAFASAFILWASLPREPSITFLDVPPGDSIVIRNGGTTFVVNGGGNPLAPLGANTGMRTLLPYLNRHGISQIDGAFLTHFNFNHAAGLLELVQAGMVNEVFISDSHHTVRPLYPMLLRFAEASDTPVRRISQGFVLNSGSLSIEALHPFEETYDNSLILRLENGGASVLLGGGASRGAEQDIISSQAHAGANVLKLANSGSAASTSPIFLEAVSPDMAIITAGRNNRFNHPAYLTMLNLDAANIPYLNTSEKGAITLHLGQTSIQIRTTN